jgi:GT2 family glycosyltransferase
VQNGPALSVVICSIGSAPVERAVASVVTSATAGGVDVEVIVVWQHAAPAPPLPGALVLDCFPVGLSYARNQGAWAAASDVVAFVDDDEVVDEGWVGAVLEAFRGAPDAVGVFGEVAPLDDSGIPYCVVTGETRRVFRRRSTPPWVVGTGGNMAFRRADLLAIGGFDVALGAGAPGRAAEESDVIVRLLRRGSTLAWTPDAVVFHPTKTAAEHLASRRPYGYGIGALVRRRRAAGVGLRYGVATVQSLLTGVRGHDRRRRREAVRTLLGFVEGLVDLRRPRSPERHLVWMPDDIQRALAGRRLRPAYATYQRDPEFRYTTGDLMVRVSVGRIAELDTATGVRGRDSVWTTAPAR